MFKAETGDREGGGVNIYSCQTTWSQYKNHNIVQAYLIPSTSNGGSNVSRVLDVNLYARLIQLSHFNKNPNKRL